MSIETEYIARVLRVITGDERHLRESPDWWILRAADRLDELSTLEEKAADKGGVASIIGRWPGDETDEQVDEALRHIE